MIHHGKLVRDLVETRPGESATALKLLPAVHLALVVGKLHEEVEELARDGCRSAEEYADVLQLVYDLAALNGVSLERIENKRLDKLEALGGFTGGRFVYRSP